MNKVCEHPLSAERSKGTPDGKAALVRTSVVRSCTIASGEAVPVRTSAVCPEATPGGRMA